MSNENERKKNLENVDKKKIINYARKADRWIKVEA